MAEGSKQSAMEENSNRSTMEDAMRRRQSAIEEAMRTQPSDNEDLKRAHYFGLAQDLYILRYDDADNDPLEFEKVVKVREQDVSGTVYYLTIEAKDGEAKKLYEAEVYDNWDSKRLMDFWPAEDGDSEQEDPHRGNYLFCSLLVKSLRRVM
ncbi:hypothetical protein EJB05_16650, partial [Eragrostis curvula]